MRAVGYPAGWKAGRRRAREVMPAAMRAEVRTRALARACGIRRACSHAATRGATRSLAVVHADHGRDRDPDPGVVAGVVRHPRAVLGALVDVVYVVGDGPAELALDLDQVAFDGIGRDLVDGPRHLA